MVFSDVRWGTLLGFHAAWLEISFFLVFGGEFWCFMVFGVECWVLIVFGGEYWCFVAFSVEYWGLMGFEGECWCSVAFSVVLGFNGAWRKMVKFNGAQWC